MSGPCTDCGGPDYQTLLARVAELEEENLGWQDESLKNLIRAGEAEAELAALKARRCWTCGVLDSEDGKCRSFSDVFREYMQDKDGECSCTLWEAAP